MPIRKNHNGQIEFEGGAIVINKKSLEGIFNIFRAKLVLYANDYLNDWDLAKDIVSNTFEKLWKKRDALKFPNENSLRGYLFVSTRYEALTTLRRRKLEESNKERYEYLEESYASLDNDGSFTYVHAIEAIEKVLPELNPDNRTVLELILREVPVKQIATMLDISEALVRKRKERGITELREKFQGHAMAQFLVTALSIYETVQISKHLLG